MPPFIPTTSTPPSTPTRSSTSPRSKVDKVAAGHARVKASPFYLARDDFREKVEWTRVGSGNRLLIKRDPDDNSPAEYAVLSCIARISTSSYYLTSDAGYKGPTRYVKRLADAKATALVEAPGIDVFDDEFKAVINNLEWLQQSIKVPGFNGTKGLFFNTSDRRAFRIRHALFEEKESEGSCNDTTSAADEPEDLSDVFTISRWPVGVQASAELNSMMSTMSIPFLASTCTES